MRRVGPEGLLLRGGRESRGLAAEFEASGFDLRALIRLVTSSHTYQLGSEAPDDDRGTGDLALANFARAGLRRLDAEVLLDAASDFLGVPFEFYGTGPGTRAAVRCPACEHGFEVDLAGGRPGGS